jgi:hypothetical protein
MIKKHESNKEELNRTDALINDYLLDVFGEVTVSELTETVSISTFFKDASSDENPLKDVAILVTSIQHNCYLVPTIKLLSSNAANESYSQPQAVLNLAEQVIDDYQFVSFKHRMTRQGVFA